MQLIDKKKQKSFFDEFVDAKIFEFIREDYKFIIVGYPYWRAFIISPNDNFRIEVYPTIDVKSRKIEIPKTKGDNQNKNINDSNDIYDVPDMSDKDSLIQSEFFDHIPKDIERYVTIFKDSHWEVLKALTYFGDNFRMLLKTNPSLGYLIVNIENLNPSYSFYNHLSYIQHLITNKQKEILARAGFPGSERLVKIFLKIEPNLLEVNHIKEFRDSLLNSNSVTKEKILKILSHLKSINTKLLEIVSTDIGIIDILSNKCILELMNSHNYESELKRLKKISIQSKKWHISIPQIEMLSQIKSITDNLKEKIIVLKKGSEFSPPPLLDNEYITALKTPAEMRSWAIKQRNCIRSFIKDVKLGKCYFYKVIYNDEEATLEIKIGRSGVKMGDLLGKGNRSVSKELGLKIREWFNKYSLIG